MICYIIGAGAFYGFEQMPGSGDCVIAADGGYAVCEAHGIAPHCILGDFDSLGYIPQTPNTVAVPAEKDDTDMMLAVKKGLELGYREFHIYGGTGGRLDHTIANLQTLLYLAQQGATGRLYDDNACFTVIQNCSVTLPGREDGIFSVFSMDGEAHGVSISGAKYTMTNGTLLESNPMGVSNRFIGQPVTVSVQKGTLLLGVYQQV